MLNLKIVASTFVVMTIAASSTPIPTVDATVDAPIDAAGDALILL